MAHASAESRLRLNIRFARGRCGEWSFSCRMRGLAAGGYESMHQNSISLALKNSLLAHAVEARLVAIDR